MSEDGGIEQNVKYWKMKYDMILDDYKRMKSRGEELENRLIEIVENAEEREKQDHSRIEELERKLGESAHRIEHLEAACFHYKNQSKLKHNEPGTSKIQDENDGDEPIESAAAIGITRSSEFTNVEHKFCEYHKLPILAKGEGFIYGFRWNSANSIHIV